MAIKPVPSLIIGLGGTGVTVATYVKKDLQEISETGGIPPGVQILAFDTEATNRVRVGGWGRPRRTGERRTGAVELGHGEYVHIGGNVLDLAKEVADGQHSYLGSWWNASQYLTENLPADLWHLNKGAGQFRQFGRMALFQNRVTATNMLTAAMNSIRRGAPGATDLYIHITGSFVGGTGAGLFADIAHLAAIIAKQQNLTQVSVRGYFVLVDAFMGTPQVNLQDPRLKSTYQAQSFACLRECSRLISAADYATGYPMNYADEGDPDLLRGRITKRLYDAVYLFDGYRQFNQLKAFRIEDGIAPTIADAIVAHVDTKSGAKFTAHTVNSDRQRIALKIPPDIPTFGALGTFTFVLPIFHIVEEWTHRLAKEVLDELLVPTDWAKDTGLPNSPLATNKRGGMKAEPVGDGVEKGREWLKRNSPTAFTKDLGELGEGYSRPAKRSDIEAEIRNRSTETWIGLLKPEDQSAMTSDNIERATIVLESDITKEKIKRGGQTEDNEYYVPPSPGGSSDRDQADQVANQTRRVFKILVGEEDDDTGRRSGGRVKATLDELKATHIKKFRTQLRAMIDETLNGTGADALEAKAGKLGYVIAFLRQVRDDLQQAQMAIEKTEGAQRAVGASKQRRPGGRREESETLLKDLDEKMRKGGGLFGANRKEYLIKAQQYLQILKSEIAERVAFETVRELVLVADTTLTEVNGWAEALGHRNVMEGGIYALVLEGRANNQHDRERNAQARVREQVSDEKYENGKYSQYISRGVVADSRSQLKQILSELVWTAHIDENTGRIRLGLKLGDADLNSEKGQNIGAANGKVYLDRCRAVFDPAWNELSILRYLMENYGPSRQKTMEDLAQLIHQKTGPLLEVRAEQPLPANFLRAHLESVGEAQAGSDEQNQAEARSSFMQQLADGLGILNHVQVERTVTADGKAETSKFVDYADSMDRFKLGFVYFSELNQPKDIVAFSSGVGTYRAYPAKQRTYLHIFPAEEHVVRYESQLPQMAMGEQRRPQRPREIEDRVVVQLEDLNRFRLIAHCLAYGNANYDWGQGVKDTGALLFQIVPPNNPPGANTDNKAVYRLMVEPTGVLRNGTLTNQMTNKPATPKYWDLTKMEESPSLLDAINQFIYKQHAVGNEEDTLDDYRIQTTLDKAIDADCARRVAKGFPWRPPTGMSKDKIREAQKRVAQCLRYQEAVRVWETRLLGEFREAVMPSASSKGVAPEVQREADLITMLILVLTEEVRTLNGQIDQYEGEWDLTMVEAGPEPEPAPRVVLPPAPEPVLPPEPTPPMPETIQCPHCGEMHPVTWKMCPVEGKPLEPPKPKEVKCPHCGEMHPATWKVCPVEGKPLSVDKPKPTTITCPHCGETHPASWKACPNTSRPLTV